MSPVAEASGRHSQDADTSNFSEVSFTSKLTEEQDSGFPPSSLSESYTFDSRSRSTRPLRSNSFSYKGKDPLTAVHTSRTDYSNTNGNHVDPNNANSAPLRTVDEASAAGASSYAHTDSYRSSANAYHQDNHSHSYREHARMASPDIDEAPYSPTTYPPISEEDTEAKRVQHNLERWAAEERQRRKAQRTSKILNTRNSTVSGPQSLAKRFSMLRTGTPAVKPSNLGAGPSSERLADGPSDSPSIAYTAQFGNRSRDSAARRASATSSASAARGEHGSSSSESLHSSPSHSSLVSDDHRPNKGLPPIGARVTSSTHVRDTSAGSARSFRDIGNSSNDSPRARDPFRDPSDGAAVEAAVGLSHKRSSLKPTPTASRPIVTVGRASSIQRRALESGYNAKGKGKGRSMPTIVATDTEAEAEEEAEELSSRLNGGHKADRSENPFASNEDARYRRQVSSTTIHEGGLDEEVAMEMAGKNGRGFDNYGDIGESTIDSDGLGRPPPARTSTSSSKFRELGITEGDDWIETVGRSIGPSRTRRMRIGKQADNTGEQEEPRKPWWSELLCGCSRDYDDDEQVS